GCGLHVHLPCSNRCKRERCADGFTSLWVLGSLDAALDGAWLVGRTLVASADSVVCRSSDQARKLHAGDAGRRVPGCAVFLRIPSESDLLCWRGGFVLRVLCICRAPQRKWKPPSGAIAGDDDRDARRRASSFGNAMGSVPGVALLFESQDRWRR